MGSPTRLGELRPGGSTLAGKKSKIPNSKFTNSESPGVYDFDRDNKDTRAGHLWRVGGHTLVSEQIELNQWVKKE